MTEEERLKAFLLSIHVNEGKVCPEYETCSHASCRSSYTAWCMADAALEGLTIEEFRAQQNKLTMQREELEAWLSIALMLQCFKCGCYVIIPRPHSAEGLTCPKCKSQDVVLIEPERDPEGFINNCARRYVGEASKCQMCRGGPCPEEAKFK